MLPSTHYKLINVQYVPYDNPQIGLFKGNDPTTGKNPASFYLANIVVETNRRFQVFDGGLGGYAFLVETQYEGRTQTPPRVLPGGPTHKQSQYAGMAYDTGGCMGCHGSQGQSQAGDFSVILARGGIANMNPEPPAKISLGGMLPMARNRTIVSP